MWNHCNRLEGFLRTNHNLNIKEIFCDCLIKNSSYSESCTLIPVIYVKVCAEKVKFNQSFTLITRLLFQTAPQ